MIGKKSKRIAELEALLKRALDRAERSEEVIRRAAKIYPSINLAQRDDALSLAKVVEDAETLGPRLVLAQAALDVFANPDNWAVIRSSEKNQKPVGFVWTSARDPVEYVKKVLNTIKLNSNIK